MTSRRTRCACVGLWLFSALALYAGELDSGKWTFTGPNAGEMRKAVDNDISTLWDSGCPQTPGVNVVIDLGRSVYAYRVYLTPGKEASKAPRSLNVYLGETPETMKLVASEASVKGGDAKGRGAPEYHRESNFMFPPAWGRYVKIELGDNTTGQSWAIAEMNVHGATQNIPEADWMTVVIDKSPEADPNKAPVWHQLLSVAARDLQYYLMELLDQPARLSTSDAIQPDGKGLWFRLVTPPEEPMVYPESDPKNLDDVSVVKEGDEIRFSGLTARAVAYSVYEFLSSQGVRWIYPDTHGDFVPVKEKLDLSMLPISYHPAFTVRDPFSSCGRFNGGPFWPKTEQASLYFLRNGLNIINDPRVSAPPRKNMNGTYHTMGAIFTPEVEQAHPEWWRGPYRLEKGANAEPGGTGRTPCTSSPEVRDFILQWIEKDIQSRVEKKQPLRQGYSIMPLDSGVFCECERCVKMFGKAERIDPKNGDVYWNMNYSDHYFHLVNELALALKRAHPELFLWSAAYAQYQTPPKLLKSLPDNVMVDVCVINEIMFPPSSPKNKGNRELMEAWAKCCQDVGMVDYALQYQDTTFSIPCYDIHTFLPMLRSVCEWKQFQKRLGIRLVSSFTLGDQLHMPWAMYAWSRAAWHPDEPEEKLAKEFFSGYYGQEAGDSLLKLYEPVERAMLANGIVVPNIRWVEPPPELFTDTLMAEVRPFGEKARKAARKWYEKERVETALYDVEWSYRVAQQGYDQKATYPCHRIEKAPTIDGELDDPAWSSLPLQKGLYITTALVAYKNQGLWAVKRPTQFRMGWDDQYLYWAVECLEPDMDKLKALGRPPEGPQKATETVDVVWAPGGQTRFTSRFNLFGATPGNWSDSFKIAEKADRWIIEARFPLKVVCSGVPDAMPKEGLRWPFNVVRWTSQESDEDTWRMFNWGLHGNFTQASTLSQIEFQNESLDGEIALAKGKKINAKFDAYYECYLKQRISIAEFDKRIEGKPNLFSKEEGGATIDRMPLLWYNNSRDPVRLELRRKTPAPMDAVRITWNNRGQIREWYSLEWWDGERYRLLAEPRDNAFHIGLHEFDPVTTDRLRVTVWGDRDGNTDGWHSTLIKNVEAFKR